MNTLMLISEASNETIGTHGGDSTKGHVGMMFRYQIARGMLRNTLVLQMYSLARIYCRVNYSRPLDGKCFASQNLLGSQTRILELLHTIKCAETCYVMITPDVFAEQCNTKLSLRTRLKLYMAFGEKNPHSKRYANAIPNRTSYRVLTCIKRILHQNIEPCISTVLRRINKILQELVEFDNRELFRPLGPELPFPIPTIDLLSPANQLHLPAPLQSPLNMSQEAV